jgi:hypothetical protein
LYGIISTYFFHQVTGGGGYTKENVARCWAVETGILLDTELPNGNSFIYFFKIVFMPLVKLSMHIISRIFFLLYGLRFPDNPCIALHAVELHFEFFFAEIPDNDYIEYFAPDYTLKVSNLNMVWNLFLSTLFNCYGNT